MVNFEDKMSKFRYVEIKNNIKKEVKT